MEWTEHSFDKVLWITGGSGTIELDEGSSRTISLETGQACLIPAMLLHRLVDLEPVSLYGLCLDRFWRDRHDEWGALLVNGVPRTWTVSEALFQGVFRRLLFEQSMRIPGHRVSSAGLVLELLAWLIRNAAQASTPETAVERVETYIQALENNFFEHQSLEDVALRLGLSRRSFTSLFRKATGKSWLQYVRRLRMEHACRLLKESNRSISSVAFECGYEDLAHFYRCFKTHTNQSPGVWRKQQQDQKA